jgi:hypothetical protein
MNAGLERKRLRDLEKQYLQSLEMELEIGHQIQSGSLSQGEDQRRFPAGPEDRRRGVRRGINPPSSGHQSFGRRTLVSLRNQGS